MSMPSRADATPGAAEKIRMARCRLIQRAPFYGYMLNYFRTVEPGTKPVRTMAVWVERSGRPVLGYNPEFVDKLSVEQCLTVLRHEVQHILNMHHLRARIYGDDAVTNHAAINWAMDAVIHGHRSCPHLEGIAGDPFLERASVFLPEELPARIGFEQLLDNLPRISFDELLEELLAIRRGEERSLHTIWGTVPIWMEGDPAALIDRLMDHAVWKDSPDERTHSRILYRIVIKTLRQVPGQAPGEIDRLLKALAEPRVDWRQALRNLIGRHLGGRRPTYARPNRRRQTFGVKGYSRHALADVLVMVDVSGSIGGNELCRFFTELESMSQHIRVRLLSFDYQVREKADKPLRIYRRGDWRDLVFTGWGGTSFQNAFDWVDAHRLWGRYNLVLTDGYADWPVGYDEIPLLWCITASGRKDAPPFGECVRLA